MHRTRKSIGCMVAQLTDTYRLVGCRPIGLSPSWLASRYLHVMCEK